MSAFEELSNTPNRSGSRSVGRPSEVEFVHSQGNIVRIVQAPELPKVDYETLTSYDQAPAYLEGYGATITAKGLPLGYGTVEAAFTIACGGGFVTTVNSKCRLVEDSPPTPSGDNCMVLPGEAAKVLPQPIFISLDKCFYSARPVTASETLTFNYQKMSLPSGCPYDVAVVVKGTADPDAPSTKSYLAAVKYTGCPDKSEIEKYSSVFAEPTQAGFLCYEDKGETRLQCITKPTESSVWGHGPGETFNYRLKSDGGKSGITLWSQADGYTSSMWATANEAGLKLEDNLGNSSFLDTGNIWLKFNGGGDYTHGYPGYFRLEYSTGAYSNLYAGGLYINDATSWVQIDPPGENAYFQKVLLGDLSLRWVLCSDVSSEPLTCDDLPNPLVKNVRAKLIESHRSPLDLCGASATYLDLAQSFMQVAATGAASKTTIEPTIIWVSDPDQSLSIEAHAVNIVSSAGSSEFSDTYLHVSRNTGAYASLDGAGWLELRNAAGKEIYLDPTQIVFTDGAFVATHNAQGFEATNGASYFGYYRSDEANLVTSSNEGRFTASQLALTQTSGGASAILSTNSGSGTLSVENTLGGKGTYQATFAKLEDSLGDSTLSTQSLHINSSSGAYATFNGSGWLELRNAAGKEIYLDPTQIVFTDGSRTATHNADGFEAVDGTNYRGSVNANSIGVLSNAGSSDLSDTYLQINSTSGAYATIDGAGWLELRNAAGKEIYLDPTQIVFTDGAFVATHNAQGFEATNRSSYFGYYRSDEANLVTSSNEGRFTASQLALTQTSGGASAILSTNSGSGTLSVENTLGGKGTYQATFAKLEDSLGDSTLSTQSLHINSSSGSYATFNGSGWLELRNAAGKEIYLDPTQIVFTNGSMTATHNAEAFTAVDGSDSGELNAQELWMSQGGVGVTKVLGGSVQINTNGGGRCTIEPPANTSAYFQNIDYIDSDFAVQSISVLSTAPIASGVFDPCVKVMECVRNSQEFPTWTDTNSTYVDWASFSKVEAFVGASITNALLALGISATCDANGTLTVTLTGVPQTDVNTPNWPTGPSTGGPGVA